MFPQPMINIVPSNLAQQIVFVQPIQTIQPVQSNAFHQIQASPFTSTFVMLTNPSHQTRVSQNHFVMNNHRYIQPAPPLSVCTTVNRQVSMSNPLLMGNSCSARCNGRSTGNRLGVRQHAPCNSLSCRRHIRHSANVNSIQRTYGTLQPPRRLRLPSTPDEENNSNRVRVPPVANRTTNAQPESDSFKCDQCERVFMRKVNLNAHRKIHTAFAYVCAYCNKKFARKSNLQQHVRIHTDERPYCCTYCPRTFRQQHSLKGHLRTHTGEKPYQCTHCTKRFAAKCNLKVHLRTHTGEKPYQCLPCNKKYASKSGYNAHIRKFHAITTQTKSINNSNAII